MFRPRIGDLSKNETLENEDLRTQNWKMILSIVVIYKQITLKFENEAPQIQELKMKSEPICSACRKFRFSSVYVFAIILCTLSNGNISVN